MEEYDESKKTNCAFYWWIICFSINFNAWAQNAGALEELLSLLKKDQNLCKKCQFLYKSFLPDEIDRLNISNTIDLVKNIPGMTGVNNVGMPQAAAYFIRGIGQDESVASLDPAVGTFVDGVFISRQIANNSRLYDVESVEVLKDPKELFMGGTQLEVLLELLRKPSDQMEGHIDIAYGEYETIEMSAKLNVPLADNIFAKVTSFYIDQGEGFLYNVTLDRDQWKEMLMELELKFSIH